MDLSRETFGHLVGQVHNRIVLERTGFFVLGEQVAVFAVGIQKRLAGGIVLILVKDFTAVKTEGVGKHLVVQHFVTREMQTAHVVLAALDHVDMDQNGTRGLDIIVLVQGREHILDHVTDQELFLVSRAFLDLAERINLRILPLASVHDIQPFLAGAFVADQVVQHVPGVFFGLDRHLRSRHPRHFTDLAMIPKEVRHLHGRLACHLVEGRRGVTQGKVQLFVEDFQIFAERNHPAQIEQASGVRQVFSAVFSQFRIQVAKMTDGVQHRIAVRLENVFLEFATAPPLVELRDHVFHDIFGGHVVVPLDIELAHLDLFALADNEGHQILVFVDRSFTVAHFGEQIALGAVVFQNGLTVAFQLALAVDLARNQAGLQLQVFFRDLVRTFENGRIECGEFLNLENEVDIGAVTHVINPGSNVVKKPGLVQGSHRRLNLFGKGRRRIALPITNADAAEHRTIVHVDSPFDLDLMNLIFDHIALGHFGHVQKLGLCKPYKHSK